VSTWVTTASPGPHDKNALPLNVLLRDLLGIARNTKEVRNALNAGKVLIDGKTRKDHKFPIGFMDVVSIPLKKKHYRIIYDHIGRLRTIIISKKESGLKVVRLKSKARKAKTYHLTTNDGRSLIVKLSEGKKYKTSDSLLIKLPSQDIVKHMPFKQGASAFITGGKAVGKKAVIKKINGNAIVITINKEEHRTVKKYVFVTGDKKSEVSVNE
jgi:small subunit ribosomal protein S4e